MGKKLQEAKLLIELIPKTCHFSNARTALKQKEWDQIRFIIYEKAGHVCEICGQTGKEQGYKHNVECHEIWKYVESSKTQKLIGLVALCPVCHQAKHLGRAIAMGKETEIINHIQTINNWTPQEIRDHISESFDVNKERSKHQWKLDIRMLSKPPYNITLTKMVKEGVKRKFKRKFKLKKRKKRKK